MIVVYLYIGGGVPLGGRHDYPGPQGAAQGQEEGQERQASRRHQDG